MPKKKFQKELDCELESLPPALRWQEWLRRVEAVLFASSSPVVRSDLERIVGQEVSVDLLISDLSAECEGRAFEVVKVADGWMLRTRRNYAPAVKAAANITDQVQGLSEFDVAVLAAIAYHQPITREGLKDIFGKEPNRDLISRLTIRGLIANGPRSPSRGSPYTFVTTNQFLIVFGFESLRDLPDKEQLEDSGLIRP